MSYLIYLSSLSEPKFGFRVPRQQWSLRSLWLPSPLCLWWPTCSNDDIRGTLRVVLNQRRFFSNINKTVEELEEELDCRHRHKGILMHPESISAKILPGNVVPRVTRSGATKLRITELEYGNFWMLKDLKRTGEKPVLANPELIEEASAQVFPTISGVRSLSGQVVTFPAHFVRKNRAHDVEAQCTLLAISFRDFGFRQLPSWIDPFTAAFSKHDRVEVLKLNVANNWFDRFFLRPIIAMLNRRNTDPAEHDTTFLHFGNTDHLCDALRMRNILVGYVFLLDGIGRVRFAGSGEATEEEVEHLISLTKKMTPLIVSTNERQHGGSFNSTRKPLPQSKKSRRR
jgi:mitochondrial ATPase complex subunit ATP10